MIPKTATSEDPFDAWVRSKKATATQTDVVEDDPFRQYTSKKKEQSNPFGQKLPEPDFQFTSESVSESTGPVTEPTVESPTGFLEKDIEQTQFFATHEIPEFDPRSLSEPATPQVQNNLMNEEKIVEIQKILTEPDALSSYAKDRVNKIKSEIHKLENVDLEKFAEYGATSVPGAPLTKTFKPGAEAIQQQIEEKKRYLNKFQSALADQAAFVVGASEDLTTVDDAKLKSIGAKYLKTMNDTGIASDEEVLRTIDNIGANKTDIDRTSQNINYKLYKAGADVMAKYYNDVANKTFQEAKPKLQELNSILQQKDTMKPGLDADLLQSSINDLMQDPQVKSYIDSERNAATYLKKSNDAINEFPQVKRQAMRQQLNDAFFNMTVAKQSASKDVGSLGMALGSWLFGEEATEGDVKSLAKATGIPEDQVNEIIGTDIKGWFGSAKDAGIRIPGALVGLAQSTDETIAKSVMGAKRFFNTENVEAENRLLSDRVQDYNLKAQKAKLFDDAGKLNFNPYSVFNTMGSGIGQTAVYAAPSLLTGGLAANISGIDKIGKLVSMATTTGTGFVGSYEDAYKEAKQYTTDEDVARSYATKVGLVNGLSEIFLEPADVAKKLAIGSPRGKDAFSAFSKMYKDKGAGAAMAQGLKEFGKVVGTENVEELSAFIGETKFKESELGIKTSPAEFINQAIETAVTTTLTTLPLGVGAGMNANRDVSSIRKQALFEAGNEPDLYRDRLKTLLDNGTIDQKHYNDRVAVVNTMSGIVANINQSETQTGKKLSYDQKANLAAQQFRIDLDNKRLKSNGVLEAEKPLIEADIKEATEIQRQELEDEIIPQETPTEAGVPEVSVNEKEQAAIEGLQNKDFDNSPIKPYTDVIQNPDASIADKKEALKGLSDQLTAKGTEITVGEALGKEADLIYDLGYEPAQESEAIRAVTQSDQVQEDIISVGELIDKTVTRNGERGTIFQDGQTLIFKPEGKNVEFELGNVDELRNESIKDFGIEQESSVVSVDDAGDLNVRGVTFQNKYSDPFQAINRNKEGDILSVTLDTEDGKKRTFRGQVAEDLAYEITLQQISKNNEQAAVEDFINEDEQSREEIINEQPTAVAEEEPVADTQPIQRKKIERKPRRVAATQEAAQAPKTIQVEEQKAQEAVTEEAPVAEEEVIELTPKEKLASEKSLSSYRAKYPGATQEEYQANRVSGTQKKEKAKAAIVTTGNWREHFDKTKDGSRKADILKAIANLSTTSDQELSEILDKVEGLPEESNIAWAVAHNPNSSIETFDKAVPLFEGSTTEENIKNIRNNKFGESSAGTPKETTKKEEPTPKKESQSKKKLTSIEEIDDILRSNKELSNIGTPKEYSQYLGTVFPDSKVKDIVYHGSDTKIQKFDKSKIGSGAGRLLGDGFYFTNDKESIPFYVEDVAGKKHTHTVAAILNLRNPAETKGLSVKRDSNNDGVVTSMTNEFVVDNPDQIHILGSEEDIAGFKKWKNRNEKQDNKSPSKKKLTSIEDVENELRDLFAADRMIGIPVGEKTNTIDQYLEKAKAVLSQLYPDAIITTYDTAEEYYDKEGRPVGSAGVFHPQEQRLALNLELIAEHGAENTIFHEVIHPIVNEAILSKEGALDDVFDQLKSLKDIPGMNAVHEHIQAYAGRGINIQKVEGITEFLTQVADGRIDLANIPEKSSSKIIDLINKIFEALGIALRISTATDLKRLSDAIKTSFDNADASAVSELIGRRADAAVKESFDAILPEEQERIIKDIISRSEGVPQEQLKATIKKYTGWSDEKIDSFFVKSTGVTHSQTKETASEFSFEGYEPAPETFDEWDKEAMSLIESGYDIEGLIKRLEEGKLPTNIEQRIMGFYLATQEAAVEKDPSKENLETLMRAVHASDVGGGRLVGQSLAARKGFRVRDNSLAGFFIGDEEANEAPLTDNQRKEVVDEYNKIQDAQRLYEEKIISLEKENARLRAEKELSKEKKSSTKSKKTHSEYVSERKEILTSIKDKLKAARTGESGLTAVPVPYAKELFVIAPDVMKLTRSLLSEGVSKLDEIVREIHSSIKDSIDGLTEKDIHDIIAGDYNTPRPTRREINKSIVDLRTEAKLINRLSELNEGSVPKTEKAERERNREIESLKKQIKNHDITKLSEVKKRINKQISDLENDLKTGNYQEPETTDTRLPVKLDKEAIELKDKLIKLRQKRAERLAKLKYENRTLRKRAVDRTLEIMNVPRTIMASMDYSAPLRQAVIPTVSHPIMAAKAAAEMFRQSISQKRFDRWFFDLQQTPRYELMKRVKLYVADPHDPRLSTKEEAFMNNLAEKIPLLGRLIKGSERAYVGFLNKMRVDLFNRMADGFENDGLTYENNPELYEGLARMVNNFTGRGGLGRIETAAPILNSIFFSPRLIASRFNILGLSDVAHLGKGFYGSLPPKLRVAALGDLAKFIGVGTTLLGMLALWGASGDDDDKDRIQVEFDPRSSDFGKVRIGNTRWDIWGGFQPYVRLIAQLITGERKATSSGQISSVNKFGQDKGTLLTRFVRGKLAPVPATALNLLTGRNIVGEKVTVKSEAMAHLQPLIVSDMKDAIKDRGVGALFTHGLPSVFGVGVQTYLPRGYDKVDTKAPVYKELYEKGLNLTTPEQGEEMDDKIYDKFTKRQRIIFKEKWDNVIKYGAYINEEGNPTIDIDLGVSIKPFNELSNTELTTLMKSISNSATRTTKKELDIKPLKK